MYAIMGEVMGGSECTIFSNPVGTKYMMQDTWGTLARAEENARARAIRNSNMKFWVVEIFLESFSYFPPQEKKYAAVFD